jgi:GTP cyclohydrolase II
MIISPEHTVTIRGFTMLSRTCIFGDNQQTATILYTDRSRIRRCLRIQYGCMFGTTFGSEDCDCAHQVAASIQIIEERGGLLIYFRDHEAFGLGIFEKAQILAREQSSRDAHMRSVEQLHRSDMRHSVMAFVPEILSIVETSDLILLGENSEKLFELRNRGIRIQSVLALPPSTSNMTSFARDELAWKQALSVRCTD